MRRSEVSNENWVENITPFSAGVDPASAADWVEGLELDTEKGVGGPRITTGEAIDLSFDPGTVEVEMRSPVTGRVIRAEPQQGVMPDLGRTSDPLAAIGDFSEALRPDVKVAVRLPGPVMTAPGKGPQQLCRAVSVALTETEAVLRDHDRGDAGIVRLVFATLTRIEVLKDGAQVSFHLPDQRVVHLDLRRLRSQDWTASSYFLRHLEQVLGA